MTLLASSYKSVKVSTYLVDACLGGQEVCPEERKTLVTFTDSVSDQDRIFPDVEPTMTRSSKV